MLRPPCLRRAYLPGGRVEWPRAGSSLDREDGRKEDTVPKTRPRITPFLWFDDQAEAAVAFYTAIFPNSKITHVTRYDAPGAEVSGRREGSVMTIAFELDGQPLTALNGGPLYRFTEALSLVVSCDTQDEVDHYWSRLSEGGDPAAQQCGWLKDRF